MQYLLDTNVIIDYLQSKLPTSEMQFVSSVVDDISVVSVISKMETLGFNFPLIKEQTLMETFVNYSAVLDIDERIVKQTILIKKAKRIKLPDAIIVATALVNHLTLITRNISDFDGVEGLKIINPHVL